MQSQVLFPLHEEGQVMIATRNSKISCQSDVGYSKGVTECVRHCPMMISFDRMIEGGERCN
jgi:hypothetical protein